MVGKCPFLAFKAELQGEKYFKQEVAPSINRLGTNQ